MTGKRIILSLLMTVIATIAWAQDGLSIENVFNRYHNRKNAVEVIVSGKQLRPYDMTFFHSINITAAAAELLTIEPFVSADIKGAVSQETGKIGSHIYYGFYSLKPRNGVNRYIIYRNRSLKHGGKSDATLIYIEGNASMQQIKKRFQ
jgi:hypothetical protein